jgi:tetratricopeptide (TPR) repeat protein
MRPTDFARWMCSTLAFILPVALMTASPSFASENASATECTTCSQEESLAESFADKVDNLLQKGDFQAALAECNSEIAENPGNAEAFYLRSLAHFYLHVNLNMVIADLNQALAIDPNYVGALIGRAYLNKRMNDYQAAIADLTQILALEPENTGALDERIALHSELEDINGLVTDFTHMIALRPDDPAAYYNRALCQKMLGEKEKAIADFQKASDLYLALDQQEDAQEAQQEIAALQEATTTG